MPGDDAGMGSDSTNPPGFQSGCCDTRTSGSGSLALAALVGLALIRPRRRR
jgi:MYXO-CTERM domain-containing protein